MTFGFNSIESPDPGYCVAVVWSEDSYRRFQCCNRRTMGNWCGIHHPDNVAKREEKRSAKRADKEARIRERDDLNRKLEEERIFNWMIFVIWLNASCIEWPSEGSNRL